MGRHSHRRSRNPFGRSPEDNAPRPHPYSYPQQQSEQAAPYQHPYQQARPPYYSPNQAPAAQHDQNAETLRIEPVSVPQPKSEPREPVIHTGYRLNPDWVQAVTEKVPNADDLLRQRGLPALEDVILPQPGHEIAGRRRATASYLGSGIEQYTLLAAEYPNEVARPEYAIAPDSSEIGIKYGFLAGKEFAEYHNKKAGPFGGYLREGSVVDQRVQTYPAPDTQTPTDDTLIFYRDLV